MNATGPPVITSLDKELFNELTMNADMKLDVYGQEFVNSNELRCYLRSIDVSVDS